MKQFRCKINHLKMHFNINCIVFLYSLIDIIMGQINFEPSTKLPELIDRSENFPENSTFFAEENKCESFEDFPLINITFSRFSRKPIRFLSPVKVQLPSFTGEWQYDCQANYPIEWVFHLPKQFTIEVREWIVNSSRIIKSLDIFDKTEFIYIISMRLIYNQPAVASNITCRSIENKFCLQTMIQLTTSEDLGPEIEFKPNSGAIVNEPILYGHNPNCALNLRFDPEKDQFICEYFGPEIDSRINSDLTLRVLECNGPLSCKGFIQNNCSSFNRGFPVSSKTLSMVENTNAQVVVCQIGRSEILQENSTALHYFFSTPNLCPQTQKNGHFDDFRRLKIYFNLNDILPENEHEFLHICSPHTQEKDFYIGQNIEFQCIGSIYFFSQGIRWILTDLESKTETVLDYELSQVSTSPRDGVRISKIFQNFKKSGNYSMQCYAPIWNSNKWVNKSTHVEIYQNFPMKFKGGEFETVHYDSLEIKEILCQITEGDPKPSQISWQRNNRDILDLSKFRIISNISESWSKIIFNPNSSDIFGEYSCSAKNSIENAEKIFHLLKGENTNTSVGLTPTHSLMAVIILAVLGAVVILVILCLCLKVRSQKRKLRILKKSEIDEFYNGRRASQSPENSNLDANSYAPFLAYNVKYEVTMDQLKIDRDRILGSGAYGVVFFGHLRKKGVKNNSQELVETAIKTIKPLDDIYCFKALLSELKIMGHIGPHKYIVNLLGAFTKNIQKREIYIALEFCENGNLLQYLRSHRDIFESLINEDGQIIYETSFTMSNNRKKFSEFSTFQLIKWSCEVSTGMEFLSSKKIIHGDIASRNILLDANLTAKIGDFGLSRQLFEYANYYIKKHMTPLPWKYLALECLEDMNFSMKSDVWAFGVTIWEIFSLGKVPYSGEIFNDEFVKKLHQGYRIDPPEYGAPEIFEILASCWRTKTFERPNFSDLRNFFETFLNNHFHYTANSFIELSSDYMDLIQPEEILVDDNVPIRLKERFEFL